jgi:hypothetical protein
MAVTCSECGYRNIFRADRMAWPGQGSLTGLTAFVLYTKQSFMLSQLT